MSGGPAPGGARFVPLACPACGGDASGRARDVVGFCRRCGSPFLIAADAAVVLRAGRLAEDPAADEIVLPFWVRGAQAAPAFLSARPLTLAQLASRALPRWAAAPRFAPPFPYGARLGPEALEPIARLARLPDTAGRVTLLAVPASFAGGRWRIRAIERELVPDDVLEGDSLRRMASATPAS